MMVLDKPRTEDGELHFVALAECKFWKAIRGVTFLVTSLEEAIHNDQT
jgi:hypothetical protein